MPKAKASLLIIMATVLTVAILFCLPFTPRPTVQLAVVGSGDLVRTLLMEGVVGYRNLQPCIALRDGRVATVYIAEGQQVHKGDLLFAMDSTPAQTALAALSRGIYEQGLAIKQFGDDELANALLVQKTLLEEKASLEAEIGASQIRATFDGTVGGVYESEGSYVTAKAVLGEVHDTQKQITALGRYSDLAGVTMGAPAMIQSNGGEKMGAARLTELAAPVHDETTGALMQTLKLELLSSEQLKKAAVGDRMTVELVCEVAKNKALVPITALDSENRIWVVEAGKVYPYRVDVSCRNDQFVAVDERWLGRQVVLLPDKAKLTHGCSIKEAKRH